tara:strand:- start:298 stop:477 length:180 start_codon:yes stop_codon:yes gene_type:complete
MKIGFTGTQLGMTEAQKDACGMRLKSVRSAREKLVQAMVTVAAAKPPSMIVNQQNGGEK